MLQLCGVEEAAQHSALECVVAKRVMPAPGPFLDDGQCETGLTRFLIERTKPY